MKVLCSELVSIARKTEKKRLQVAIAIFQNDYEMPV